MKQTTYNVGRGNACQICVLIAVVCSPSTDALAMAQCTVPFRPIVQSYVMRGRELNKFGSCHMSFGLMNIPQSEPIMD